MTENLLNCIRSKIIYDHASNNKSPIHICYGIDENYARSCGTSILSICKNNDSLKSQFIFHILSLKLSDASKYKLEQIAKKYNTHIIIYELDITALEHLPIFNHYSIAIYFRLILPILLKKEKQCIYIDADILCINNSKELFKLNIDENIIAAVPDVEYTAKNRIAALKLKDHVYFNSDFLVINIPKWNDSDISAKVIDLLQKSGSAFSHPDQDALNILLHSKIKYLSKHYNFLDMNDSDINNAVFLHFAAKAKPWYLCWHVSPTCNEFNMSLYKNYEDLSPWKNTPFIHPRNYKECHFYAKCLKHHKYYLKSFAWYLRYSLAKLKYYLQ